jgi:hypothetical protein
LNAKIAKRAKDFGDVFFAVFAAFAFSVVSSRDGPRRRMAAY